MYNPKRWHSFDSKRQCPVELWSFMYRCSHYVIWLQPCGLHFWTIIYFSSKITRVRYETHCVLVLSFKQVRNTSTYHMTLLSFSHCWWTEDKTEHQVCNPGWCKRRYSLKKDEIHKKELRFNKLLNFVEIQSFVYVNQSSIKQLR